MAQKLSAQELIKVIVAAGGRLPLAAERCGVSEQDLIAEVTAEGASLGEQLRTAMIINLFDTMMETQIALKVRLEDLSPDGVARAYAGMVTAFSSLTAKPTEDATEKPVSIEDAKERLMSRLNTYEEREAPKPVEELRDTEEAV